MLRRMSVFENRNVTRRPVGRTLLAALFPLALVPCAALAKRPQGFSGEVGLGASSSTGTSQSLNVNTEDGLYWLSGAWSNTSHLSYNYARSGGPVVADRLAIHNSTRYLFSPQTFALGDLGFVRNHFDGYFYRVNETAGIGHYFYPGPRSRLTLEAGVGAREAHRIGGYPGTDPIARLEAAYRLRFSKHASLREAVDAILSANGADTYESRLDLDTPLYGALGMRFSFLATYNTQVLFGYRPFNTLTAVNLAYHF